MTTSTIDTTIKVGGTATTLTNAATTEVTANTVFQITDATKRVLDPDTALVVEVDSGGGYAAADPDDYTVDYMFGKVTFAVALGGSDTVRISGKYIPTLDVLLGTDCELEEMSSLIEKTTFGDGSKTRLYGINDSSGSFTVLELLQTDLDSGAGTRKLLDAMRNATKVILEYQPGGAGAYWRGWVCLSQAGQKSQLEGRIEGTVQFSTHAPNGTGENELAVPTWGDG